VKDILRAAFCTLGCKVNQYETAALERLFAAQGFAIVPAEEQADVYVVNSCTVTAQGDRKSRRLLRRLRRKAPGAVVALCGCYPQASPQEAAAIPEADIITGSRDRAGLLSMVLAHLEDRDRPRSVRILPHEKGEPFEPLRPDTFCGHTRAFVKIQDGCERFCAYCIIPRARGPVRSKPLEELRRELDALAASGYKEVVLVGINLPSYGQDLGLRLLDAVRCACEAPGIPRVRLGSLEPELLTGADIAGMARLPGLCPQFHLSLQSGCDETLRRMRRHYDTAEYRRIAGDLRAVFPGCAITTDIMVGFPGETPEEFRASLAFAREIAFAKVHVFAYSRRPGTPADRLPGQVPEEEKACRSQEMTAAAALDRRAFLAGQVGTTARVLLENRGAAGFWEGYTPNYTPVRVTAPLCRPGELVQVLLTGAGAGWCTAVPAEHADPVQR